MYQMIIVDRQFSTYRSVRTRQTDADTRLDQSWRSIIGDITLDQLVKSMDPAKTVSRYGNKSGPSRLEAWRKVKDRYDEVQSTVQTKGGMLSLASHSHARQGFGREWTDVVNKLDRLTGRVESVRMATELETLWSAMKAEKESTVEVDGEA